MFQKLLLIPQMNFKGLIGKKHTIFYKYDYSPQHNKLLNSVIILIMSLLLNSESMMEQNLKQIPKDTILAGKYVISHQSEQKASLFSFPQCMDIDTQKHYQYKIYNFNSNIRMNCLTYQEQSIKNQIQAKLCKNQINIWKKLKNHHIVNLIDYFQYENNIYTIFQRCKLGNLKQDLETLTSLKQNQIVNIFQQLISGLAYIHSQDIILLCLSPTTILVDDYGFDGKKNYKLFFFEYAKKIKSIESQELLLIPEIYKIPFLAPQIRISIMNASFKSDVWSLGLIFYYVLFRRLPEEINQLQTGPYIKDNKAKGKPITFPKNKQVSPSILHLLEDMLVYDPEKRYSLAEVQEYVKKLQHKYSRNQ